MKLINILHTLLVASVLAPMLSSCGEKDEPSPTPPPADESRTVLVYMVANNNLRSWALKDMIEMQEGVNNGGLGDKGRLLVYHDAGEPTLIEILPNRIDTLETYPYNRYAVQSERMLQVIDDSRSHAPAADYGLVLWSHGTGWIQNGMEMPETRSDVPGHDVIVQSFGDDRGKKMNVTTLAEVLESRKFSWLYFDCCLMNSVEVAYQLRNAVPLIAGSQIELPAAGMPYHLNIEPFFASGKADLIGAASNTYGYYNGMSGYYCAMSVIDTSALDRLAAASRNIFGKAAPGYPAGHTLQDLYPTAPNLHFDFSDYIEALCMGADGATPQWPGAENDLAEFHAALAETVIYEDAMPYVPYGSRLLPLEKHCGLATFVMKDSEDATTNNYNTLSWYADVASALFH